MSKRGISSLEMFGEPEFDEGLPCDTQMLGLVVQSFDHPVREVDVHALIRLRPDQYAKPLPEPRATVKDGRRPPP